MSEFLTIGEPLALFASTDLDASLTDAEHFQKFAAGAELNVAVGVSRLGHATQYLTQLGQDPLGDFIIQRLENEHVDVSQIQQTQEFWTGIQMKNRVSEGDPATHYFRTDSAAAHFDTALIANLDIDDVQYFHFTGIFPAISTQALSATKALITRIQQKQQATISFDPNLRPSLWGSQEVMIRTINELAFQANIILPGIGEAETLTGTRDLNKITDFYFDHSDQAQLVIVKLGSDGAFVKDRHNEGYLVPGYQVKTVVDTVGAGDGFTTGLITALAEGLTVKESVRRGNAIGALAVQSAGDNDGYPTKAQLKDYQKNSA